MKKLLKHFDRSSLILILILLIGLWFRIQGFLYGTFAFTYDVGRDLLALSQIIQTHKLPLIGATTGLHGIFYGPTWYYLLIPFFLIARGDPKGLVLVMVASGVLTALIGFFVGKYIGGNRLGLILALLLSLSQILNQISAQIWNPNLIPLFVIVIFYVILFKSKTSKNLNIWYVLAGLLLGIIFDLEIVFGVLFVISTALYFLLSKKLIEKKSHVVLFILGFIFIQLPRVFFEMRHSFLMTNAFFNTLTSHSQSFLLTPVPNFLKVFLVLLNVWSNTVAAQILPLGIVIGILVCLVLIKSYKKLDEKERGVINYSVIILIVYFVGLSFFNHDIESHYYIGLPVIYILLLSLSVYFSGKYIKIPSVGVFIFVVFFALSINQLKLLETFQKSTWIGDASVYRNQLEVVDYIYKDANGAKFNYVTYTPPIFDYPYQYIFQFEGKNMYGYLPDINHEKLFYLIIEPDPQMPERQKMWLDVRNGDGKIISEKLFKSGIRVQKRIH